MRALGWFAFLLLLGPAITFASAQAPPEWPELELVNAYRLSWPGNFQPSGLTACQGKLLTVSDRHDLEIQEIRLGANGQAEVRPFGRFTELPPPPPLATAVDVLRQMILTLVGKQYDWEGITCDDQGSLYLASEAYSAVLKIPTQGPLHWITLAPHPEIQARKLLGQANAGIEGVQWLPGNSLMIAAESNPAGLIRCRIDHGLCHPEQVRVLSDTQLPPDIQTRDISGVSTAAQRLYVLERYHARVCRRDTKDFKIERCYSFKATEKHPRHAHRGAAWGQAEGLQVLEDRIFLVIDNNGRVLRSDPSSTDTWLFEFRRPDGF